MKCRHCNNKLNHLFADLHYSPPSNGYLTFEQLSLPEVYYPLRVQVCDNCWLVQTEDYVKVQQMGYLMIIMPIFQVPHLLFGAC